MKNHESSEHADLEKLQDGAIIGDGRSDFTEKTESYTLKHNNQSFVLLDVPGIEGDEKKVKEQISDATRKAHAIFYVTKTPAPPQKGEEKKKGRLKRSKNNLIRKQRYGRFLTNRLTTQELSKMGLLMEAKKKA